MLLPYGRPGAVRPQFGAEEPSVEISHFSYGLVNPVMAYAVSFLGSLLGLICTARARSPLAAGHRQRWLLVAAIAIGGTGIWLSHFMAMLGFTVVGGNVHYDVSLTVASALTAVGVVWVGLLIVGTGATSPRRLLIGGLVAGLGVASMHHLGMAAMRIDGDLGYRPLLVLASVAIAVVATTGGLWFTIVVLRPLTITLAALLMGAAVCGMHYVGMAAVRVHPHDSVSRVGGVDPFSFLMPVVLTLGIVMIVVFYTVLTAPEADHREPRTVVNA